MNYKSLFSNIRYRGLVKSVKNDFHVLEGPNHYVVVSTKYQYSIVPKKAVAFIVRKLGGTQSLPVAEAFATCSGSKYFPDKFAVLHALYAMVAVKQGKICRIAGNKLFFNIWKA
jgi:hypothetical protein